MGVVNHNAIVVTTWSDDRANELQSWISQQSERDQELIVRVGSWVNGQHSFFVAPDGSKEGWEDSDEGDALRDRIVERLAVDGYEDGSSPWSWVEVGFGKYGQKVLRGNCVNCYNDADYAV